MNFWDQEYLAVKCRLSLEANGLRMIVTHDTCEASRLVALMGKQLSPMLDRGRNLFTSRNSLWMFAMDGDLPAIGGGVRVDDIGDEPFGSYLPRAVHQFYGVHVLPGQWDVPSLPWSGRVAYFGDLGASTSRGLTSMGAEVIRHFTTYGHHRVFTDLGADCTYCFLRERDRRRAVNFGFLDTDPFLWQTNRPLYPDGNPGWIAHLAKIRMPALLASVSKELVNTFAENDQSLVAVSG